MELSIILVSYNTETLTRRAIASVFAELKRSNTLLTQSEIIVVDNASTDSSVRMLKRIRAASPVPFSLVSSSKNLGFAGANNKALQKASGKFIFFLNPDTYVQAGCLEKLIQTLNSLAPTETTAFSAQPDPYDRLGILAATLLNQNGTIQPQGGDQPTLLSVAGQFLFLYKIPLIGQLFPTTQYAGKKEPKVTLPESEQQELITKDWVACTAMLVRKQVIDEIGPLDTNIFMYGEDVEFCLRATAHHWDVAQHPSARVTHIQSASAGFTKALLGEAYGYAYIWAKHKPAWQKSLLIAILQIGALLRMVVHTVIGSPRSHIEPYERIWQESNTW